MQIETGQLHQAVHHDEVVVPAQEIVGDLPNGTVHHRDDYCVVRERLAVGTE